MNKKGRKIMKEINTQKGITLIALIITIVVLLILATVAVSSIQNDGILRYAQNVAGDYEQAQKDEQDILDEYLEYIEDKIGDATVGTKVDRISTINGQLYSENNPVIPSGFMPINTTASKWDVKDLAAEVKKGLVISDGISEFVWIPVETLSEFAKVTSGTDANKRTNYEGKLYTFPSTGTTERTEYGQSTTSYREPANLTAYNYKDQADRFTTIEWDEDYYQEAFNKMVESVAEYKGFYVGRYEMSINSTSGKAESVAGATSARKNWWWLYEKATTYSTSGVISEMIWGCQYDAMMRWMQGNSIDVRSTTPTDTNRNVAASYNSDENRITGAENSNDILNNIYDLLGNSYEFTQEALNDLQRVRRGGSYTKAVFPAGRGKTYPKDIRAPMLNENDWQGTRLAFYIEC